MWTRLIAITTIVTLLAGFAMYVHSRGKQLGMMEVQASWDQAKLLQQEQMLEEQMKAKQREQALQTLVDRLRQEKAREAKRIAAEYAAAIDSLRDRPETRASAGGVPEGAAAGVGCTGAGLSRRDAEFLVGFAADAARLQLALNACQAAYNALTD